MNNRHVFLTVLETGKFKIKRPAELVLVRTHFLFYRTISALSLPAPPIKTLPPSKPLRSVISVWPSPRLLLPEPVPHLVTLLLPP